MTDEQQLQVMAYVTYKQLIKKDVVLLFKKHKIEFDVNVAANDRSYFESKISQLQDIVIPICLYDAKLFLDSCKRLKK